MTTITPVKFFPPKTEGWSHNIKCADGYFYGCREEMVTLFTIGQPIDVEITTKEKNGTTYRDIKRVIPNAAGATPAPRPAGATNGSVSPQYQKQPTPLVDAERMFVAGALNSILPKMFERDNGLLPSKVADTVNMFRQVWSETFGAKHE